MMNLVSFETPHLRREERVHATTTTRISIIPKDGSSRNTIFDGHLDLSLGMSMSSGGSGCDATGCGGANKANDVGSKCCIDKVGCMSGGVTTVTPSNALSAEHGHVSDLKAGADWTSAFMPSPTGFMHPWSLAARQQKAAAEQDRTQAVAAYVPSEACGIPLPSAEGLPPVHTSRRNLITAMHTVDGPKGATTSAGNEKKNSKGVVGIRPLLANMFAKVHMEGYAIARKINLRAHGSYDSLSRVLTKMTRNFFSPHSGAGNYHVYNLGLPPNNMIVANSCLGNEHYTMYTKAADCSSVNAEEEFCSSNKFIFLYEDFEGDRLLIGDVPWELFLASAKRLYIVRNPMLGDKGHDDYDKNDTTEKTTNN